MVTLARLAQTGYRIGGEGQVAEWLKAHAWKACRRL
jgi:hypothetical protein